jgi:hypothetical protein
LFKEIQNIPKLLYRLVFVIRSSLGCLDLLSASTFMALFNHLIAFFPSQSAVGNPIEPFPEAIISLSFETLKKFVSCRELGSKLKLNAYDTLGCFDGIRHCTISAYFEFIEKLLRSPISKEYTKYSSKILNIITTRIEKEYSNCIQDNQDSNMYVTECFRLIEGLLKIKGLLDEQYEAIETELAKIFLFINASKVDFTTEILKIGSGVVRAAGSHLSIMDPIVESFATVFERNDYELTDLYEVFYSYILKDSTFVLKEEQSMGKTSLNFVTGKPISSSNRASADKSKLTPFNAINQILLQVLNNACSDASRHHISTVLKALLLIILEMQIYNEGGLNDYFKMLLDSICSLLERIEKSFETLRDKKSRPNLHPLHLVYLSPAECLPLLLRRGRLHLGFEGLHSRIHKQGGRNHSFSLPKLASIFAEAVSALDS